MPNTIPAPLGTAFVWKLLSLGISTSPNLSEKMANSFKAIAVMDIAKSSSDKFYAPVTAKVFRYLQSKILLSVKYDAAT